MGVTKTKLNKIRNEIKKGDVIYVDLSSFEDGSVQGNGVNSTGRPCVVVGKGFNSKLIVCALTTKNKKDMPTHTRVKIKGRESIALLEQLFTIEKEKINSKRWHVTEEEMNNIESCLKISLGL